MSEEALPRLAALAGLVRDAATARLAAAASARDAVRAQIAALDATRPKDAPPTAAEARVAFAYDQWASRRRASLNTELARHEALCLALRAEAARALGRASVIDKLKGEATSRSRR